MGDLDMDDSSSQESDIKRFWGYIKKSRKDSVGVPTLNTPNGPLTTDQSKADALNTLFESAFNKENLDEYSYYVRTIPLWNSLPNSPASATSINSFQRLAAIHCGSQQP